MKKLLQTSLKRDNLIFAGWKVHLQSFILLNAKKIMAYKFFNNNKTNKFSLFLRCIFTL